jgi:hypothetical protein
VDEISCPEISREVDEAAHDVHGRVVQAGIRDGKPGRRDQEPVQARDGHAGIFRDAPQLRTARGGQAVWRLRIQGEGRHLQRVIAEISGEPGLSRKIHLAQNFVAQRELHAPPFLRINVVSRRTPRCHAAGRG